MIRCCVAFVLLFYAFAFRNNLFAQYSDLKEYGLKGKVKSMTRHHYLLVRENGSSIEPVNPEIWISKTITYFNKNGNIDSMTNCTNFQNYEPSIDRQTNYSRTIYYFDNKGRKTTGVYIGNINEPEIEPILINWVNKYQYIEKTYRPNSTELKTSITAWLNVNYRDSAGMSLYYYGDSLMSDNRYISKFNDKNELLYYVETELVGNEIDTIQVEIKTKDMKGNPTKTVMYKNRYPTKFSLYIRTYEYYND